MKYLFLFVFIFFSAEIFAQKDIHQQDKEITAVFADTTNSALLSGLSKVVDSSTNKYFLIKVYSGQTKSFKQQFQAQIKRQLNVNWFIVKADSSEIQNNISIEQYFVANNNWKLSPALLSKRNELSLSKNFIFLIEVSDSRSLVNLTNQYAAQASILSTHKNGKIFRVKTSFSFVAKTLLDDENILFVDIKFNTPNEETVINDYDNSVNDINLFFAKYPAVNGKALTVSVKENLFDTTDIDFKGRYKHTTLTSTQITSYATTMTTLIGGASNSFYTGKGIAWCCNLSSSDFAVLLPDANSAYRQYNISVQNHSYGVGVENFYGSDAAAYDQSMIDNPSLLHIFSAGNSGNLADSIGQYKDLTGFANYRQF